VLPRSRWRNAKDKPNSIGHILDKYLGQARALSPSKRAELTKPVDSIPAADLATRMVKLREARDAKPKASDERRAPLYWRTLEKAQVHRAMRLTEGQKLSFARRVTAAMKAALPPDRWMTQGSLWASCRAGTMQKHLDEGARNEWVLKADDEATSSAELPAALAGSDAADLETGGLLQRAHDGLAPIPAPAVQSSLAEASAAFAATLSQAVGVLLQASAAHTLNAIEARVSGLATEVGLAIAAQIERGLRQTVLDTMAQELGGPVSAPPAPAPAVKAESVPTPKLKVDVVGLIGVNAQRVKDAFNGNTELRFIDVDHTGRWDIRPDSTVVVVTKFLNHKTTDKIKAARLKPVYVQGGGAPGVIQAIEELHRAHGVPTH
jgi:hypothetical protein